jgi:hypothetical protein
VATPACADSIWNRIKETWEENPAIEQEALIHYTQLLTNLGCYISVERLVANVNKPDFMAIRARSLYLSGDDRQALKIAEKVCSLDKHNTTARLVRAAVFLDRNHIDSARVDVVSVLRRHPRNTMAMALLTQINNRISL